MQARIGSSPGAGEAAPRDHASPGARRIAFRSLRGSPYRVHPGRQVHDRMALGCLWGRWKMKYRPPPDGNWDTVRPWPLFPVAMPIRPGTAGLLIDIECSRLRDSSWMYLTSFVTTRIGIELAAVQRKLPDCVIVGLQQYSAKTFHVTLSPRIYKGGQGPPPNNYQHLRQYKLHMT